MIENKNATLIKIKRNLKQAKNHVYTTTRGMHLDLGANYSLFATISPLFVDSLPGHTT